MARPAREPKDWWVAALLLVLAALFFWRLWLNPAGLIYPPTGYSSDLTVTHWPNALFIRRSLAQYRQLPLWRPLILSGEPFAANPLSGLWYPPNMLLLVLPLNLAFNLLFLLHTVWAGWGGYKLTRALGAAPVGATLAALALAFAPKAVAHLGAGHVGLFCAWAWLPWMLWATHRLGQRNGPGEVAALAVSAAMLVLADVRMGVYAAVLAGGTWLWSLLGRLRRCPRATSWPRLLLGFVLAAVLGGALFAVQGVPLLAVAPRLSRGTLTLAESAVFSLPPRCLVGLLVAAHGGSHEWMTYVGAVVLALAVVGMVRWPGRDRWWWGGVLLASALYALGTYMPVYGLLLRVIPALGWLRVPARSWFLVTLAAAILAAQGMTALERRPVHGAAGEAPTQDRPSGKRRSILCSRRGTRLLSAGLAGVALVGVTGSLVLRLPANVALAAVLWPAVGLGIVLCLAGRLPQRLLGLLLLGLELADLWIVGATLYRVQTPEGAFAEGAAAAEWLAAQPGRWRVYSPSYSIPQHVGAQAGIEAADGVDPFQLSTYRSFMYVATGAGDQGYSVIIPQFADADGDAGALVAMQTRPNLQWLGLLNVRYLAAGYPLAADGLEPLGERDGVTLYENAYGLPRAFVVQRAEAVPGQEEALAWLGVNDPAEAAAVENGPSLAGPAGLREARLLEWTPNRIVVEAEGPGLLVLSEVYDPDWRAQVAGRETEVVRVDGILRGVYLDAGAQRVELVYQPAGLWLGASATALGWTGVAVLAALGWRDRRRARGQEPRLRRRQEQ